MTKLPRDGYNLVRGFFLRDCLEDMQFTLTMQTFGWCSIPCEGLPIAEAKAARLCTARKVLQFKLAIIRYQRYVSISNAA